MIDWCSVGTSWVHHWAGVDRVGGEVNVDRSNAVEVAAADRVGLPARVPVARAGTGE